MTDQQAVIQQDDRAAEFRRRLDTAIADLVVDEDQQPVSDAAIQAAERFIKGMPVCARMPSVSVDPDGAISLDWGNGASGSLSINIDDSECIVVVWHDGREIGSIVVPASEATRGDVVSLLGRFG